MQEWGTQHVVAQLRSAQPRGSQPQGTEAGRVPRPAGYPSWGYPDKDPSGGLYYCGFSTQLGGIGPGDSQTWEYLDLRIPRPGDIWLRLEAND